MRPCVHACMPTCMRVHVCVCVCHRLSNVCMPKRWWRQEAHTSRATHQVAESRPHLDEARPTSAEFGPSSVHSGRKSVEFGPHLAICWIEFGRSLMDPSRIWSKLAEYGPKSVEPGPKLADAQLPQKSPVTPPDAPRPASSWAAPTGPRADPTPRSSHLPPSWWRPPSSAAASAPPWGADVGVKVCFESRPLWGPWPSALWRQRR